MATVNCPNCGEEFQVVIPEEMKDQSKAGTGEKADAELQGEIVSWDVDANPTYPYSGWEGDYPDVAEEIDVEVRINGQSMTVSVWYTPHAEDWDYFKYVIHGPVDIGYKTLNFYDSDEGLFIKNRATPWTSEKNWTYLTPEQLERRSRIAGLGDVIEDEEGEGGYGLLLDLEEQPLVDDGQLAEDLVVTMTKALLVMKSSETPAGT